MIKSITVTNYLGDSIELELTRPDKSGFIIKSVEGLGPTKASIKSTKMAGSDGEVYNSSTLDKRNIVFDLEFLESRDETIEDVRLKSYKYFPINTNVKLLIKTDKREVTTTGYVETNEPNIFSDREGCSISVLCHDPYLYALGENRTSFGGVSSEFSFPFTNDSIDSDLIEMGSIEYKTENFIHYDGEAPVGVNVVMHTIGEVGNIAIHNLTNGETMKLDTCKINALASTYDEWCATVPRVPGYMDYRFTYRLTAYYALVLIDKNTGEEFWPGEFTIQYLDTESGTYALYKYINNDTQFDNASMYPDLKPSVGIADNGSVIWEKCSGDSSTEIPGYPLWYSGSDVETAYMRARFKQKYMSWTVDETTYSGYVLVDKYTDEVFLPGELILRYKGKLYAYVYSGEYSVLFEDVPPDQLVGTYGNNTYIVWQLIEEMPLQAGDTIYIATEKGNKTITLIRDGITTNILNSLDRGTSWFTLSRGNNVFVWDAESGSENLQFSMSNKTIYLGV